MSMMPWMVAALPVVEWYLPEQPRWWPALRHATTRVQPDHEPDGRRRGDTVWLGVLQGRTVGVALEWVEMRPGVVAMVDPNAITTNLRFITRDDAYEDPLRATIAINRIVHELPWQHAVCEKLAVDAATALAA